MKTCPNCHHPVAPGNRFCENCGYDLSQATDLTTNSSRSRQPSGSSKAHHSRKATWILSGVFVVVLAIVIFMGVGFYHRQAGKSSQIDALAQTIVKGQNADLAKSLVSSDPSLKITSQSVQPFLDYTKQHPHYIATMKQDLKQSGKTRDGAFEVVTSGHTLGILPVYKIQVTPMYPKVHTNEANATIMANKTALITAKSAHYSHTVGPLFPGQYTFKLTGATQSTKKTVTLIKDPKAEVTLNVKSKAAKATTNASDYGDDADITDDTSGDDNDTDDYDDLSSQLQTGVDTLSDEFDFDSDDYTYKVSEPHPDVYEIKTYDDGDHDSTFRYDAVHDIGAIYDSSKGKFVSEDDYYDD
ncbi:TcaA second domain-containing protein [Levilactobacillus suantsaii]|uniref:Zinc-ribbon domain-containing protein n=1 Tax=Levilactobacillus suantsaii TaxID=2292255 RepID=A0A4Q0VF47_9LACO|nr:zinc-ribbon domain-containing protein [Levilactobacillus suantsaii]RXI75995.1 zinc-ribbon domain-containing protein [Levilactobacillus suantsaii]